MQSCTTLRTGIEELVDRRADGDDHRPAGRDFVGGVGEHQPLGGERLGEHRFRAALDERQLAAFERVERCAVEVVDVDAQAGFGQRQHQRNADMAGTADHRHVGVLHRRRRIRRGNIRAHGHRGFSPLVSTKGRNGFMTARLNTILSMKL